MSGQTSTTGNYTQIVTIQPPPCYESENPCDNCAWRNTCKKYKSKI